MAFQQKYMLYLAGLALLILSLLPGCAPDETNACGKVEFSKENTVTVRMEAAATSLNPILPGPGYNRYAAANVFQALATVEPKSLEMVPVLIKKVPTAYNVEAGQHKGCIAYDFELYDEAVWDNGSPVTANDFLFSLKIIHHPLLPLGEWLGYFELLKAIEIDPANPKKFTIFFNKFYILALESLCQFPIYPAYNYDPDGTLSAIQLADLRNPERAQALITENPALAAWAEAFQSPRFANDKTAISGSGAYRVENFDVDQGVVFTKKQNWWGDKLAVRNPYLAAYPDKIIYRFVKDEVPAESLIRSGDVDIVPQMSPTKFLELKADSCLGMKYDFQLEGANSYGRVMCNLTNPRLSDKRVRQALAYAIDYDYLLGTVWEGLAKRCSSPVNPAKPFFARDLKPYTYDIKHAKELLAAAGWTDTNGNGIVDKDVNGTRIEMEVTIMAPTGAPVSIAAAKSIQKTARAAGIALTLLEDDIRVIAQKTRQGEYELAVTASTLFPGLWEPYQSFHTKSIGAGNRYAYSNLELDRLIEALRTEPDVAKRNISYIKAQHILYEDLPEIFLYSPQQRMIVNKRFKYVISANRPGYYEQYFRLLR
ncbi:MAG: ABC transporter substrate-binding protein [Saprospiraceae bacterium]